MSEIELHQSTLSEQMDFARAVAHRPEGGAASLLPDAYRENPGNILIAVGLGQSMGLSPAESLYRISVIKGKPSASAELIAANVRKAGHRLRVKVTEDPPSATCTIVRSDDPEEPTVVTRDMEWAQRMGLANEPNYRKQPATMLSWRAISACARLACPEALYGVTYTPDEIEGSWDGTTAPPRQGGLAAALAPETAVTVLGVVGETAGPDTGPLPDLPDDAYYPEGAQPLPAESPLLNTSSKLAKAMYAAIHDTGIPEAERIVWLGNVIGREIDSSKDMTEAEARDVLRFLEQWDAEQAAKAAEEGGQS